MQEQPYYTYRAYMINRYSKPLFSIPIDLNLGCPNRNSDGSGGCTFCPSNGARAAQSLDASSVEDQIKKGIEFSKNRYKAQKFMLYIQAYTGTFTSVINQKKIYSHLLKQYNFDAISIGTRPDCLNTSTLEYLKELNEQIDVHVDLGVQTLNDETLTKINRGHDSRCSIDAIKRLKEYGIKVFAHVIVGFEGETRKDWENTARELVKLNVDGIKIHNLHIIKHTQLQEDYEKSNFKIYNEYEYANEVINLIRHIPPHIPIIRISTDTPSSDLIAPIWHMQKGQFGEYLNESMVYRGFRQGDLVEKLEPLTLKKEKTFELEDNSITIWDKKYKDYYHPKSGAYRQAKDLFIKNSKLEERLETTDIELLDIGFGMGYNSLEALKLPKNHTLNITALDKNRTIIKTSTTLKKKKEEKEILEKIYDSNKYKDDFNNLEFIADDARNSIRTLNKKFDVIFLDAFIHTQNPALITEEFFMLIKKVLKNDGVLVCSNSIDSVKSALSKTGFKYECCDIDKTDIKGLVATFGESSNSAKMYKDPYLVYRDKQIVTMKESS